MIDVKNFSPKDAKLIRENEGKSIYELLQLGISQKAGDRLAEMGYSESSVTINVDPNAEITDPGHSMAYIPLPESNVVKPATVRPVDKAGKVVHTKPSGYKVLPALDSDSVRMVNVKTGKAFVASGFAAKRLLKYPNEYKLLA
jgi:hypothetical protein